MRDDDFGAFMFERYELGVFMGGVMISVQTCVRGRILVHLIKG